jgi:hypothetical protein
MDRSAAELFDYVTNPSRFRQWQDGVIEGHMQNAGPTSVGDRCLTTRRIGFVDRQGVRNLLSSVVCSTGSIADNANARSPSVTDV